MSRRERRSNSEPPDLGISVVAGEGMTRTRSLKGSYGSEPVVHEQSTLLPEHMAVIARCTNALAERVTVEVRAFVAARLDDFVAEHDRAVKEILKAALLPRKKKARTHLSPHHSGDSSDEGMPMRKQPSDRSASPSIEDAATPSQQCSPHRSEAKNGFMDAEVLKMNGWRNAPRAARRASGRSCEAMSRSVDVAECSGAASSPYSLDKGQLDKKGYLLRAASQVSEGGSVNGRVRGGRRSVSGRAGMNPKRQNSRASDHSSASVTASLKDLERDVAMRLVEESFGDANSVKSAAARRKGRGDNSDGEMSSAGASLNPSPTHHRHEGWIKSPQQGGASGSNGPAEVRVTSPKATSRDAEMVFAHNSSGDTTEGKDKALTPILTTTPRSLPGTITPAQSPSRRISVSRFLLALPMELRRMSIHSGATQVAPDSPTRSLTTGTKDDTDASFVRFNRSQSTGALRKAHERSISRQGVEEEDEEVSNYPVENEEVHFSCWVFLWLQIWGIFPCCKVVSAEPRSRLKALFPHWNQGLMLIASLAVLWYRLWSMVSGGAFVDLTELLLAAGSTLCIVSTWKIHSCDFFDSDQGVLMRYAGRWCFASNWQRQSRRHLMETAFLWLLTVVSRLLLNGVGPWRGFADRLFADHHYTVEPLAWTSFAAFAFSAGIFFSTVFCLLHFTSALVQGVDSYGRRFQLNPDCDKGVRDWNVLQAVLRQASSCMEHAIVVLLTTSMLMLFVCAVDVVLGNVSGTALDRLLPLLVPTFVLAAGAGRVLVHCSEVTGRCRRVSPFVTSLSSGSTRDELAARLALVQYIDSSAAGFYIREVVVTAADSLKLVYLGGMAMITIFTKAATPG